MVKTTVKITNSDEEGFIHLLDLIKLLTNAVHIHGANAIVTIDDTSVPGVYDLDIVSWKDEE